MLKRHIIFHLAILMLLLSASCLGDSEQFRELRKPNYHDDDDSAQCTEIREPVCQGLQYPNTRMPNWVKMNSQEEAAKRMIDYKALLNINCSHYLKLFLCTIYFPMCTPVLEKSSLKPCKPLCIHVRNRCEPIMRQFQFSWPAELSCEELPAPPQLCVQPDGYADDAKKPVLPATSSMAAGGSLASLQRMYPQFHDLLLKRKHGSPNLDSLIQAAAAAVADRSVSLAAANDLGATCTAAEFSVVHFSNDTCFTHCGADLFYQPADKRFARTWLLGWSILCAFSSALTFLTFFLDRLRLQYPERPVLYLAACYFVIGAGFILQYGLGPERVTCRSLQLSEGNSAETQMYLLTGGQESTWCTVGFLISYYFGMASNLWWVMLSLSWYLSTSRKWSHEGVESVSSVFHMFAWALPAIQSILILILHKIDADELTGTCYTGFHSETTLLFGVLLPQAACLLVGLILLSVGFAAVFRVHRKLKTPNDGERESRRRLEKSIAKLGVFVVLYTFPMACLLAGNLYEYLGQPRWRAALQRLHVSKTHCLSPRGVAWGIPECTPDHSPSSEAAMLRIFMSFVIGITSGMWVWANKKTLLTWKSALCGRGRRQVPDASRGSFGKLERPNAGAQTGGACLAPGFCTTGVLPVASPKVVDGSEVDRPQGHFSADSNGVFSTSVAGYSSGGCQSCHMCPPAPAPTDVSVGAGGYSSASGQSGSEMYGGCYLHSNAHQHLNQHHDHLFHHQQHHAHQIFPFKSNGGVTSLLHRPPTTTECI